MSNRKGKRFNSACSVIEERNFFSFLEPNSAKNSSKKIADFTRDTSPQIFSAIISPKSPNNFGKKLLKPEFLMKKNALILERAQVLSKANKELKKQLEKKCLAPKDLFKTHAVHLTRESFSKVYSDLDIAEPFREIKKVLAWISAQKDEFCIKNVKHAIEKISGIVTNLQVETEAKMQILTLEYEKTIKNLEEKVAVLGKNSTEKEKNITKSLVSKNLQLSATINRLEKVVNEQTVRNI